MKMKQLLSLTAIFALMLSFFSTGVTPVKAAEEPIKVQLLSMNDLHGKIDQTYQYNYTSDGTDETIARMDYAAAYLKQYEATNPNTLIVNSGDMIGASSPVSALLQDEPTVEIMEAIGFDVGTVGNHEFDEGTQELVRMVNGGEHPNGTPGYDGMNFPVLAANVKYKDTGELVLDPYVVKEIAGVKIGFIGVVTPETADMVIPTGIQDIEFTDGAEAVNAATEELKSQGVEAIVVLAHMAAQQNGDSATGEAADLANDIDDEVDVIIAAHNHLVVDAVVDNKLIVQAYEYGKAFADIDLEIDPTTQDIIKKEAEVVYVDQANIEPDPTVAGILAKYAAQTGDIMNQVIGTAAVPLEGGYATKGPVGDNALGNLIADGMLWAMDSDFALMNGGGIRDDIDAGPITWSELFNVQPFGNTLVKLDITGADLEKILNSQISVQYGPEVSVGGFSYTWDSATNKVVDIFLPDGSKIDKNATYSVTVNNYMSDHGSDKYLLQELGENKVQGPIDLDATVNFVKSFNGEAITYEAEGRISEITVDNGNIGEVSIAEARAAETGSTETITGVVTSPQGAWGNDGFYIQDETGGLYVYQYDYDVNIGDKVKVTGKTSEYRGELQLEEVSALEILETGLTPEALEVTPEQVGGANEGQLVKVEGAIISDLEEVNSYGTFEFTATKNGESVLIRVDNRTGLAFDDFGFANGDVVNIVGISGQYNGTVQLKPRMASDIQEFELLDEITIKPELTNTETQVNATIFDDALYYLANNGTLHVDLSEANTDKEIKLNLTKEQMEMLNNKSLNVDITNQDVTLIVSANTLSSDADAAISLEKQDNQSKVVKNAFTFTQGDEVLASFTKPVVVASGDQFILTMKKLPNGKLVAIPNK